MEEREDEYRYGKMVELYKGFMRKFLFNGLCLLWGEVRKDHVLRRVVRVRALRVRVL